MYACIVGCKLYECMECRQTFASTILLTAHVKTHGCGRNFPCTKCSASFTTNGSLQRHLLAHSTQHQCPLCPESFRSPQLVEQHIRVQHSHTGSEGTTGVELTSFCSVSYAA